MEDIVPELLKKIMEDFAQGNLEDSTIMALRAQIESGSATYKTAEEYAARLGEILGDAFRNNVSSDVLPDGKMYYNIASRILEPTLTNNYQLTADAAQKVQQALNEAAGLGIKAQVPELNTDRVEGIINHVSNADYYDDVSKKLLNSMVNFSMSVVTETIQKNAKFQYNSGLSPVIVRTAEAGACEVCRDLEGTYNYSDVQETGNKVWSRHENCHCSVEYDPRDGKRQNVYTKQWRDVNERERIDERKNIGLKKDNDVTKEYIRKASPKQGKLDYETGYNEKIHGDEIGIAEWLHNEFGGDIMLLNEKEEKNVKTPDLLWNGRNWEIKSISSQSFGTVDKRIRRGCKQIAGNTGGLILDFSKNPEMLEDVIKMVEKSAKNRIKEETDIIIKQKEKYKIIRITIE
jgi:hypothetical protein